MYIVHIQLYAKAQKYQKAKTLSANDYDLKMTQKSLITLETQ